MRVVLDACKKKIFQDQWSAYWCVNSFGLDGYEESTGLEIFPHFNCVLSVSYWFAPRKDTLILCRPTIKKMLELPWHLLSLLVPQLRWVRARCLLLDRTDWTVPLFDPITNSSVRLPFLFTGRCRGSLLSFSCKTCVSTCLGWIPWFFSRCHDLRFICRNLCQITIKFWGSRPWTQWRVPVRHTVNLCRRGGDDCK